jgi:hypothetical protein
MSRLLILSVICCMAAVLVQGANPRGLALAGLRVTDLLMQVPQAQGPWNERQPQPKKGHDAQQARIHIRRLQVPQCGAEVRYASANRLTMIPKTLQQLAQNPIHEIFHPPA